MTATGQGVYGDADSKTVLVVDDHEAIRELLRTYLEIGGHRVLDAGSGREAREVAARYQGEISHMVVDLVLPGENGGEIARSLATEHPRAAILFISGMDQGAAIEAGHIQPGMSFLKKPFGAAKLEAALHDARLLWSDGYRTQ
jgi:two-component system cell cycle sensor histidine kinase/response regulator CckA